MLLRSRVLLLEFLRQLLVLSHDHGLLHGHLVMLTVHVTRHQLLLLVIKVLLRQLRLLRLVSAHGLVDIAIYL